MYSVGTLQGYLHSPLPYLSTPLSFSSPVLPLLPASIIPYLAILTNRVAAFAGYNGSEILHGASMGISERIETLSDEDLNYHLSHFILEANRQGWCSLPTQYVCCVNTPGQNSQNMV